MLTIYETLNLQPSYSSEFIDKVDWSVFYVSISAPPAVLERIFFDNIYSRCCIIFIDIQVVVIVVIIVVIVIVIIVVVIVVIYHIYNSLHRDEDEGDESKGGEL